MQKQIGELATNVQENFILIKKCSSLKDKMFIIQRTYSLVKDIERIVADMDPGYKKDRYQKQLKTEETDHQIHMAQRVDSITLSIKKLPTIIGEQMLEKQEYDYNPRITVEQNLIRKIIAFDARQSRANLKDIQIESMAVQMEKQPGVMQDMTKIIMKKQPKIKTQKVQNIINQSDKQSKQQYNQGQLGHNSVENRITLDLSQMSALQTFRSKLHSRFSQIGFALKSFFKNIFTSKKSLQKSKQELKEI